MKKEVKTIKIPLSVFNDEGNCINTASLQLTTGQISDIIDQAARLIETWQQGEDTESLLSDLQASLVGNNVIDYKPIVPPEKKIENISSETSMNP